MQSPISVMFSAVTEISSDGTFAFWMMGPAAFASLDVIGPMISDTFSWISFFVAFIESAGTAFVSSTKRSIGKSPFLLISSTARRTPSSSDLPYAAAPPVSAAVKPIFAAFFAPEDTAPPVFPPQPENPAIMMAAMEQIPIVFITFLICIICVSS